MSASVRGTRLEMRRNEKKVTRNTACMQIWKALRGSKYSNMRKSKSMVIGSSHAVESPDRLLGDSDVVVADKRVPDAKGMIDMTSDTQIIDDGAIRFQRTRQESYIRQVNGFGDRKWIKRKMLAKKQIRVEIRTHPSFG